MGAWPDEWVRDALECAGGSGANVRCRCSVLTGPPGAGKSSVVVDDDIPHAIVETEALTATHPPLDEERWLAFVKSACRLHREHGRRLLLVAATVEGDADLRALLAAVGADQQVVVRPIRRRLGGGSSRVNPKAGRG